MEKNDNDPPHMTSFASGFLLWATANKRTGGQQRRRDQRHRHTMRTMTPGTMTVGADKGGIKNRSADDGGTEESVGQYNNQTWTGVGVDNNDARMLLSWIMGARVVDSGSADDGYTVESTADSHE